MILRWRGYAALASLLAGCATVPEAPPVEISLFALNDFHGYIQASRPLPARLSLPDPAQPGQTRRVDAGGAAHIASALAELGAAAPNHLLIGAGDLIGASPSQSALLRDEPAILVLNRLGMSVSSIGNHELDRGQAALLERATGQCGAQGCATQTFDGARFDYLAANVLSADTGRPWLKPYVLRELGGQRIAFVGAVTRTLPAMIPASALAGLQVEDEAIAINRVVPEIRAQGIETIIALIHEGAEYAGPLNVPDDRCEGLSGPIVDIVNRLDPAVDAVFSAHTHQGYACRINGRLVLQGRNYGTAIAELRLKVSPRSHDVIASAATIHLVDQARYPADPAMAAYVAELESLTAAIRGEVLTELPQGLPRQPTDGFTDSPFGTVVADAQLAAARRLGPVDIAFTNAGGVRTDLPAQGSDTAVQITHSDAFAAQPFGNHIVVMSLRGEHLLQALQQQFRDDLTQPLFLHSASGLSYRWRASADPTQRLVDVKLAGEAIVPTRVYRVAVNNFLADGGDGYTAFTHGEARSDAGGDLEALKRYLSEQGQTLSARSSGRIRPQQD